MKIITVVGARPQFIKAAMVSRAIREYNRAKGKGQKVKGLDDKPLTLNHSPLAIDEVIIHTGQHYDYAMSQSFFDQMDIPAPRYHLDIGSGSHGDQTGRMLAAIERVLIEEKPDAVLVYGDTNSTLAGALAASKLHIPVGHVEGGMRSFNRRMPEEINRVLTDHIATWHFCPTETAVNNLAKEGITTNVFLVGDVMHEAVMLYKDIARERSDILQRMGIIQQAKGQEQKANGNAEDATFEDGGSPFALSHSPFALCTIHRAENTDDPDRLRSILEALVEISKDMTVVVPLHPRTKKAIERAKGQWLKAKGDDLSFALSPSPLAQRTLLPSIKIIEPVSYLDMLQLESHASIILTDSGGMQKEAFWLGRPCVTMRDETEWVETVEAGWNKVTGADSGAIIRAAKEYCSSPPARPATKSDIAVASASASILNCLVSSITVNR